MSISDAVAPHIPYLRRFARALSGTQAAGDAYVAATLEAILADPDCFDPELAPKTALYKLFLRSWRNVPLNRDVDHLTFGDEAGANRNLAAISLEPRIAFLLSAVELLQPDGDRTNAGLLGTRGGRTYGARRKGDFRSDPHEGAHYRG